ncbi:MAG: trypsin-like serine protease [Ruminococcaceae bacterium]|nr:trypsin-like serine protease [Oscillospiraceae bacterium]
MNDFQNNDRDNVGDNYNREYGQDIGGEYSYSYTPKNTPPQPTKGIFRKYVFWSVVAIILALLIVCSGIVMGSLVVKSLINNSSDEAPQKFSHENVIIDDADPENESSGKQDGIAESTQEILIPKPLSQNQNGLTSAGQPYNSITEVYGAVSDSVVEITTEVVQNSAWMGQYVSTGAGSGVIIHADGYIVTNHHVIDGANNVTVTLKNGNMYKASFIGTDEKNDIAVIKIEADEQLSVAVMGCSNDLVVGEDVIAIGNPLGSLGGTVTEGIISATERHISINGEDMVLLQTSAAINPGNSGGGLFNMAGQLIGVVNAKAAGEDIEGLGFAVPIDTAHPIVSDLINYGYVRGRVDHGITAVDVTSDNLFYYTRYGITQVGVIVIESLYCDELLFGDRIIALNGIQIDLASDMEDVFEEFEVGDTVTVKIMRNGESFETETVLKEKVPGYTDMK